MNRAAFVVTVFLTLTACSHAVGPAWLPRAASGAGPSNLGPRHFHATPFFSFRGGKLGSKPVPGLIGDTSENLYGVTGSGGDLSCSEGKRTGCGVIYELVHVGGLDFSEKVVHAFHGADGAFPNSALAGEKGVFFGTTSKGGANGGGTVYAIAVKDGRLRTLYAFKGGSDGAFPIGKLFIDANGNVFGTTAFGGKAGCAETEGTGCGTVFALMRSKSGYTKKTLYEFSAGRNGWEPWAGVISYNGSLYGTTIYGGNPACKGGCGTIFKLSPAGGGKRTVHEFAGGGEGAYAKSPLYADSSGNLYGETQNGGATNCHITGADADGCGAIFRVSADGSAVTILHRFGGGGKGAQPNIGLTHFKGTLFGTTTYGTGVAFAIQPGGKGFSVIDDFKSGANPSIFLCAISNELNGTTSNGGKYGFGTIFKLAQ